jgi:hypothetical protein
MGARSQAGGDPQGQHPNSSDEPPVPGGDPDQPPPDLPKQRRGGDRAPKLRDDEEYGHVGVDDRPESNDKPKPHQIY